MFQERLKGVSRECSLVQWVSRIFERNLKGISEKYQGCLKEVSRKFQVCSDTVFKLHQGSFKKVSRVF